MTIQLLDWAKLPGDLQDARHYREYTPLLTDEVALAEVISSYGLDITHDPRQLHAVTSAVTTVKSGLLELPGMWLHGIGIEPFEAGVINRYILVAWANMLTTLGDHVEQHVGTAAALGEPTQLDPDLPPIHPADFKWGTVRPGATLLQAYLVLERNKNVCLPDARRQQAEIDLAANLHYSRRLQLGRPLYAFSKMVSWQLLSPMMYKLIKDINANTPPGNWRMPEISLHAYISYVSGLMYACLPAEYRLLAEA